jgi:outer membrane lipoprotein SlyB
MLTLTAAALLVPAVPSAALAPDRNHYQGKVWRDGNGHLRCKRTDGTTGLIVGAAGGALIGRAIDSRGERATGTILGAAAGALLGRGIDRSRYRCQ